MKSHTFNVGEGVEIDLPRLIGSRLLCQANSGGGKSWLIRRILEQTHGKVQQIVLDLEGEFGTLREKYDYILAGKGGDVAAEPRSAAMLARKLLEYGASAVVDLYELNHQDRKRFVKLFIDAMMNAPKELWHPVLVVVDEAHVFCPEKGQAESADAVIDLATRGRKRGFCCVLATQRLSKLHKDAAAECNNKLIGRTGLDVDMKRAYEELGFTTREQYLSLRQLDAGQFFAFGPAISREVVTTRVGPVETTHPKAGQKFSAKAVKPTAKMREVIGKLGDIPKEAEQEAHTVDDLRRQLGDALRECATLRRHVCPKVGIDQKYIEKAVNVAVKQQQGVFARLLNDLRGGLRVLEKTSSELLGRVTSEEAEMSKKIPIPTVGKQVIARRLGAETRHTPVIVGVPSGNSDERVMKMLENGSSIHYANDGGAMGEGEKAVLNAAAQRQVEGITKEHLTVLLGYRRSTRDAYIQRLRSKGYVKDGGGVVYATAEGMDALGSDFRPLPTGAELREKVLRELPQGEKVILEQLINSYPTPLERDLLTETTGYARSSRDAYLQRLGARQLVAFEGRGLVKASDKLF